LAGQMSAAVPASLVAEVCSAALAQAAASGGVVAGGGFAFAGSIKIAAGVAAGLAVGYLAFSAGREAGKRPAEGGGPVAASVSGRPSTPAKAISPPGGVAPESSGAGAEEPSTDEAALDDW